MHVHIFSSLVSHTCFCRSATTIAESVVSTAPNQPIANFCNGKEVLSAEIYWALHVTDKHYSFKSCDTVGDLFRNMFPDSAVASRFSCGEKKCAYLSTFGIRPYFQSLLLSKVKSANEYVLLFDESLNANLQSKQLDIHIRFWEGSHVSSRFYTSEFLGHADADCLHEKLLDCCTTIGKAGLLQMSMDGPNVNWKTYELLSTSIEEETKKKMLNIGSCGLHIIHNAFRSGSMETNWEVGQTLSSLYWLFKDSPARREDFVSITGSSVFPKQFCSHRWVENVTVVERALEMWSDVKQYVATVKQGKAQTPKNKSFSVVAASCGDALFEVKANIFLSIANEVAHFLNRYQTDMPMLPFLAPDMFQLVFNLLERFVKEEALAEVTSTAKLVQLDLMKSSLHKNTSDVDIGFVANKLLLDLKHKKKISEKDCYSVKADTKTFLITLVKKLLLKAPLRFGLVRNLAWLHPLEICHDQERCLEHLGRCLRIVSDAQQIKLSKCDNIIRQYKEFIRENLANPDFQSFIVGESRLDVLLYDSMANVTEWADLWELTKRLLLLSHGQASVERGFSINKEISVENMTAQTLISQRVIKDHLLNVGGVTKVSLTKELLVSASHARQRYQAHLDEEKRKREEQKRGEKRKATLEELDNLKQVKKRMKANIEALLKSADQFAEEAESTGKITLISKSNAMRRSAKEKEGELKSIEEAIDKKLEALKN